jgi:hypothetical protein
MMRARPSSWAIYAEPLLGIVAAVVVATTLATVHRIAGAGSRNDFTVFLESARWLREGADPYQRPIDPGPGQNLNTPATALVFLPFSFLPTATAFQVWTVVAIAAYLLVGRWIAGAIAPGRTISIASAILIAHPAIVSLLIGQITALLMLLVTAAWIADREERPWRAGVLVGVAVAAKPFLGIWVVYALWRRSRPLLAGLCLGFAAAAIVGLIVGGISGYRSWLSALGQISWTAHVLNASLLGFFTRTLSATPDILQMTPIVLQPRLVQPLWWGSVAVVVALGARTLLRTRDRDRVWALVLVSSLLLSPLGWMYYVPLAAGPLLAVAAHARRSTRAILAAGYVCLLLPLLSSPGLGVVVNTALFASMYFWGVTLLFAGICTVSEQSAVTERNTHPRQIA